VVVRDGIKGQSHLIFFLAFASSCRALLHPGLEFFSLERHLVLVETLEDLFDLQVLLVSRLDQVCMVEPCIVNNCLGLGTLYLCAVNQHLLIHEFDVPEYFVA